MNCKVPGVGGVQSAASGSRGPADPGCIIVAAVAHRKKYRFGPVTLLMPVGRQSKMVPGPTNEAAFLVVPRWKSMSLGRPMLGLRWALPGGVEGVAGPGRPGLSGLGVPNRQMPRWRPRSFVTRCGGPRKEGCDPMQGGLAPLSISIVLAEAHTKPTAPVFPFRASSRPVGVGEGPIAKRTHAVRRAQGQGVKGEEGREEGPQLSCPARAWRGVA